MLQRVKASFVTPDGRTSYPRLILFALLFLAVYRIGWQFPLPIIDQTQMWEFAKR